MGTATASARVFESGAIVDLGGLASTADLGRERIADRLRQLRLGLERFEEALWDGEPEVEYPEIDQVLAEISPRRRQLVLELSRIEEGLRTEARVALPELWRELERAIGLVTEYEAAVSDIFLRAFWLDLGVGD